MRLWLCGGVTGALRWLELLAVSVYVLETDRLAVLVALLTFLRMAPMLLAASRPARSPIATTAGTCWSAACRARADLGDPRRSWRSTGRL